MHKSIGNSVPFLTLGVALVCGGLWPVGATTLTTVPMQGTMVMPVVSYSQAQGALQVALDPAAVQLTPLLVSNPADSFNPADPWYAFLDPSRQGLSFSRRYGFVMAATTDPLPPNTAIWIRKVSGPDGLGIYRYTSSVPKGWQPIFGTAGVTNALYWSGAMFHPAVTARPGTNALAATFEAYLLDTGTGSVVPNSSSGPFVLTWSNVPDGRPTLSCAPKGSVSWPGSATNWVLEATDGLGVWTTVAHPPVLVEGAATVRLEGGAAQQFLRLRRKP
jgi:hypothetical protein